MLCRKCCRQRWHRTLFGRPPSSVISAGFQERRFHNLFCFPPSQNSLKIEAAPMTPARQASFSPSMSSTPKNEGNPEAGITVQPQLVNTPEVCNTSGSGMQTDPLFDRRTLSGHLQRRAGAARLAGRIFGVHLLRVLFSLLVWRTISSKQLTPKALPNKRPTFFHWR